MGRLHDLLIFVDWRCLNCLLVLHLCLLLSVAIEVSLVDHFLGGEVLSHLNLVVVIESHREPALEEQNTSTDGESKGQVVGLLCLAQSEVVVLHSLQGQLELYLAIVFQASVANRGWQLLHVEDVMGCVDGDQDLKASCDGVPEEGNPSHASWVLATATQEEEAKSLEEYEANSFSWARALA